MGDRIVHAVQHSSMMAASGEQEKDGVSEAAASVLSGLPDGSKSLISSILPFAVCREGERETMRWVEWRIEFHVFFVDSHSTAAVG